MATTYIKGGSLPVGEPDPDGSTVIRVAYAPSNSDSTLFREGELLHAAFDRRNPDSHSAKFFVHDPDENVVVSVYIEGYDHDFGEYNGTVYQATRKKLLGDADSGDLTREEVEQETGGFRDWSPVYHSRRKIGRVEDFSVYDGGSPGSSAEPAHIEARVGEARGVGSSNIEALAEAYDRMEDIESASVAELREVPGVGKVSAESIVELFEREEC